MPPKPFFYPVSRATGTLVGSYVLRRMSASTFATALKVLLTVLAVNLLAVAFGLYAIT